MRAQPVADRLGRFGEFGGRYVPEALIAALEELEREWDSARSDAAFEDELTGLLRTVVGRPTPLYEAERFSELVGARVLLKREDLAHTGRSEEHTSELQSRQYLVCRLLLEKTKIDTV